MGGVGVLPTATQSRLGFPQPSRMQEFSCRSVQRTLCLCPLGLRLQRTAVVGMTKEGTCLSRNGASLGVQKPNLKSSLLGPRLPALRLGPLRRRGRHKGCIAAAQANIVQPAIAVAGSVLGRIPPILLIPSCVAVIVYALTGLEGFVRLIQNRVKKLLNQPEEVPGEDNWSSSRVRKYVVPYVKPVVIWAAIFVLCGGLDRLPTPLILSKVKAKTVNVVRVFASVFSVTYCITVLIQQMQAVVYQPVGPTEQVGKELVVQTVEAGIWFLGFALGMELLGVASNSFITAGGIGTLVFTFAGKEIVGNALSGMTIQATKPFTVGDWISIMVNGQFVEGHVEAMGWWQLTLKTFERESSRIANQQVINSVITNVTAKTHWRFKSYIHLYLFTPEDQVQKIVMDIRKLLAEHPKIEHRTLHRRVFYDGHNISVPSKDVLVSCYFQTRWQEEYAKLKEELMYEIERIISLHGSRYATPIRTHDYSAGRTPPTMSHSPYDSPTQRLFLAEMTVYKNPSDSSKVAVVDVIPSTPTTVDVTDTAVVKPIVGGEGESVVGGKTESESAVSTVHAEVSGNAAEISGRGTANGADVSGKGAENGADAGGKGAQNGADVSGKGVENFADVSRKCAANGAEVGNSGAQNGAGVSGKGAQNGADVSQREEVAGNRAGLNEGTDVKEDENRTGTGIRIGNGKAGVDLNTTTQPSEDSRVGTDGAAVSEQPSAVDGSAATGRSERGKGTPPDLGRPQPSDRHMASDGPRDDTLERELAEVLRRASSHRGGSDGNKRDNVLFSDGQRHLSSWSRNPDQSASSKVTPLFTLQYTTPQEAAAAASAFSAAAAEAAAAAQALLAGLEAPGGHSAGRLDPPAASNSTGGHSTSHFEPPPASTSYSNGGHSTGQADLPAASTSYDSSSGGQSRRPSGESVRRANRNGPVQPLGPRTSDRSEASGSPRGPFEPLREVETMSDVPYRGIKEGSSPGREWAKQYFAGDRPSARGFASVSEFEHLQDSDSEEDLRASENDDVADDLAPMSEEESAAWRQADSVASKSNERSHDGARFDTKGPVGGRGDASTGQQRPRSDGTGPLKEKLEGLETMGLSRSDITLLGIAIDKTGRQSAVLDSAFDPSVTPTQLVQRSAGAAKAQGGSSGESGSGNGKEGVGREDGASEKSGEKEPAGALVGKDGVVSAGGNGTPLVSEQMGQ